MLFLRFLRIIVFLSLEVDLSNMLSVRCEGIPDYKYWSFSGAGVFNIDGANIMSFKLEFSRAGPWSIEEFMELFFIDDFFLITLLTYLCMIVSNAI